jgi:formiminotetrahydrofolate cyclodeaminase
VGYEQLTVAAFVAAVAEQSPAPASGAAIAVTGSLAAALVALAASFADDRPSTARAASLRARLLYLADEDAEAYRAFMDSGNDEDRSRTIEVPLSIAEAARDVIDLARGVEQRVKPTIAGDAAAAAALGAAVVTAAAALVVINADGGDPRAGRARELATEAARTRVNLR